MKMTNEYAVREALLSLALSIGAADEYPNEYVRHNMIEDAINEIEWEEIDNVLI